MRSIHTNTNTSKQSGFTIVELLIVIVVIAILAAITIVSYNGITSRANSTSAQAAANIVLKKAEAFNAETGAYPAIPKDLTEAAADKSYSMTGTVFAIGTGGTSPNFTAAPTTAPASPSTVIFYACTNNAGFRVAYWKYDASSPAWTPLTTGTCATATFKSNGATS